MAVETSCQQAQPANSIVISDNSLLFEANVGAPFYAGILEKSITETKMWLSIELFADMLQACNKGGPIVETS
ncbi:MAG: hypothetical protein ABSA75_11180 [Candidatus Bathyarchaeia archaeon]